MTQTSKTPYPRHTRGKAAEAIAEKHLSNAGLKLITKNHRCKLGEIDLIFLDQDCLVFVEVRARVNAKFAYPTDTIDYHKQRKIILTAQHFLLQQTQYANHPCRFDAVGIDFSTNPPSIEWIQRAF